jgi:hypothetical protein
VRELKKEKKRKEKKEEKGEEEKDSWHQIPFVQKKGKRNGGRKE